MSDTIENTPLMLKSVKELGEDDYEIEAEFTVRFGINQVGTNLDNAIRDFVEENNNIIEKLKQGVEGYQLDVEPVFEMKVDGVSLSKEEMDAVLSGKFRLDDAVFSR